MNNHSGKILLLTATLIWATPFSTMADRFASNGSDELRKQQEEREYRRAEDRRKQQYDAEAERLAKEGQAINSRASDAKTEEERQRLWQEMQHNINMQMINNMR